MSLSRARGLTLASSHGNVTPKKFMRAVTNGDVYTIRRGLKRSISVTSMDPVGRNALHIAAIHSQEQSVRVLLDLGLDPALNDKQEWSPLHASCSVGHCEITELLIAAYEARQILCKLKAYLYIPFNNANGHVK